MYNVLNIKTFLTKKPRGIINVPEFMGGRAFTFYTLHVLWCEHFRINILTIVIYYNFFSMF